MQPMTFTKPNPQEMQPKKYATSKYKKPGNTNQHLI